MSYDLAILGANCAPCRQVSINIVDHVRLIAIAKDLGLPLIQRVSDYYADTEFLEQEMEGLLAELMRVRDSMISNKQVIPPWVSDAITLVAEAQLRQSGIVGIAD